VSKFDSDGTPLWTQQFGTDATDRPTGVASDVSGNVFVTGSTSGALIGTSAGNADVFVLQLDSDGKVLWTHQFGTDTLDTSTGVASDASGNVIVAGFTNGALDGASAGSVDAFVRKLDGGGTPLWTQQFGTSASDSATGVASDVSGNVIVAGNTSGALEGSNAGSRDVFVRKLDVAGTPLWTQQFGTDASDRPTGVASDVSDNVIVAGHTSGALDGSNEGSSDVFVRAYAP
ncbi:MAG: SBBP repeat-containing protein, partial [Trueperaceae bacterium]